MGGSGLARAKGVVLALTVVAKLGCTAGGGGCSGGSDVNDNDKTTLPEKLSLWTDGTRLRRANVYQRRVYPELGGDEFVGADPVGPPRPTCSS
jgi:hypothetical protein